MVLGLLLGTAGLFVYAFPLHDRQPELIVLQYALIAYSALRATVCVGGAYPRYASLTFWLFLYTLFGLVQLAQLSVGRNPFGVAVHDEDVISQLVVLWTGSIACDIASWYGRGAKCQSVVSEKRHISPSRLLLFSWTVIIASPLAIEIVGGGLETFFSSRLTYSAALAGGDGLISPGQVIMAAVLNVAPIVGFLAWLQLRRAAVISLRQPRYGVPAMLLLPVNAVFNNPVTQPRYWVATVLIAIAIQGTWRYRPAFQIFFVAAFIFCALVLFPYLDVFRKVEVGEAQFSKTGPVTAYLEKTDYGSPQDVTNAITYVSENGHTSGGQILGTVLFWVPRSMWEGKPGDTAWLLADHINYPNRNIDSPLWAEGYIDFNLAGTVVWLGAFGYVVGRGDRTFSRLAQPSALAGVVIPLLVGYELILLRGSLLQATARLAVILLLAFLISRPRRVGAQSLWAAASKSGTAEASTPGS